MKEKTIIIMADPGGASNVRHYNHNEEKHADHLFIYRPHIEIERRK